MEKHTGRESISFLMDLTLWEDFLITRQSVMMDSSNLKIYTTKEHLKIINFMVREKKKEMIITSKDNILTVIKLRE